MAPQQNIRFGFNPGFAEVVFNSQISVASGFLNTSFRDLSITGYDLDANLNNYLHYVSGHSDKSDYKLVDQLTELGCSHDQRNVFGLTPMMLYIANDMDLAVEKALIHGADPTIHDDQFRNSYMLADLHKSYESLEVLEIFYMDGSPNGSRFKLLNKRLSDEIKDFKDPKITPELLTKESREDGVSNLYQFARYGFLSEIIKKLGKKTSVLTSDNILEFGSHFAGHEDTPLQAHTLFNREYGLLLKADLWKTNPKGFRVFTSCIPLDEYPLYKDTINKVLQELKPPFTARINDKENNGLRLKR